MPDNPRAERRWTRLREFVHKTRLLWWTAGVIVLAALMIVLLWKVPQVQVEKYVNAAKTDKETINAKDRFNIENEARRTMATALGAIILLGGAYFTWRNIKLVQEGQITDRFTKAIEQLGAVDASGKKKLEVRLGGIYALERIANQSERDHWPIMEVLCTYVRENSPAPAKEENPQEDPGLEPSPDVPPLATDIQAILTVLGRRDRKYERDQILDLRDTDIRGAQLPVADLSGANLRRALLRRAWLGGVNLSRAFFDEADLCQADLPHADLHGAVLDRADLRHTNFISANLVAASFAGTNLSNADLRYTLLRGANFSVANWELELERKTGVEFPRANLRGAHLGNADFRDANLSGTDLRQTEGLTQEQVNSAKGDSNTQLPDGLHVPDSWKT
jgi:uncharacterized protein YjbI with pentapeptide repeats